MVLAALSAAGAAVWAVFGIPEPFLVVLGIEAVFFFKLRARVLRVIHAVGEPAYGLALFAEVLARFGREKFRSPSLVALQKQLAPDGVPPSHRIARLNRLMELLDSSEHWLLRLIDLPLLYRVQLALAIEAWRKKSGPSVRRWLAATGELEALCAFANYAYEHPSDVYPEFTEESPSFEGEALAHPLLPESRAVRNDMRLCGGSRAMVVSGSNMSGKSTLLRTIGINAVLAMAGAPVRARRLRLSPLAVGASIRTMDSLQGGTSRFYTEIKRLRKLVDLAKGSPPLLFLLDELLQGTNSHDRRIGAEAIVRGLVEYGAIGLVTTHDLALAIIADVLAPRAQNVHFEDHLEDGKITFDYRLRPGVVRKSNALELMRSVGLDV
jgi:DNA mismatch repair ATPase MutS